MQVCPAKIQKPWRQLMRSGFPGRHPSSSSIIIKLVKIRRGGFRVIAASADQSGDQDFKAAGRAKARGLTSAAPHWKRNGNLSD
jgi:hypothetical protein